MKSGYRSWERLKATRFLKLVRFLFCPRENKESFILEKCVNTKTSKKRIFSIFHESLESVCEHAPVPLHDA